MTKAGKLNCFPSESTMATKPHGSTDSSENIKMKIQVFTGITTRVLILAVVSIAQICGIVRNEESDCYKQTRLSRSFDFEIKPKISRMTVKISHFTGKLCGSS